MTLNGIAGKLRLETPSCSSRLAGEGWLTRSYIQELTTKTQLPFSACIRARSTMKTAARPVAVRSLNPVDFQSLFFCPSCTVWRKTRPSLRTATRLRPRQITRRDHYSTATSTTAINGRREIPSEFKPLYDALVDVERTASAQINLSRLKLALQGLETETPTTRIAVLGLNVQSTARRIVRLLLADALEKEASWEQDLLHTTSEDYSRGLFIRYGHPPNSNLPQPKTSIPVLYVPSSVLERNNIEILVSTISAPQNGQLLQAAQTIPSDAFLSPSVGTPTAASGRQVTIAQPVHNCLLVADGLDELVVAAELLASTDFSAIEDRDSVKVAVSLDVNQKKESGQVGVINTKEAEEGLAAIRRSIVEAPEYEHKWMGSGMPTLSSWFSSTSAARSEKTIPAPVTALVSSLLTSASANLRIQAKLDAQSHAARGLSLSTRTHLEETIEEFSRNAHQELQSGLSSAWHSRNWRKLAWYKLFWRVDDVGLIITDLVTNSWLPRTERAVYELSGRLSQVGISPVERTAEPVTTTPDALVEPDAGIEPVLQAQADIATEPPMRPVIANPAGIAEVQMVPVPRPQPLSLSISRTRAAKMDQAIAELTSTAQQIVLKTLSLTGLSGGLSLLTYLSITPGSLYEAGTIAALGTAYALWRMQGDWQKVTHWLESDLHDEGKTVVRRLVTRMRELIENRSRIVEDEVEVQSRQDAENAVARARAELDRLQK
jgi:hypothetical protein